MEELGIFISHTNADTPFCDVLDRFLREHVPGASIFYDKRSVLAGDVWMGVLQREVMARKNFLVVLSRQSVAAEWVREEVNLALSLAIKDRTRRILPIVIEETLSNDEIAQLAPLLNMRQHLQLFPNASAHSWNQLIDILRATSGSEPMRAAAGPVVEQPNQFERARMMANEVRDAFQMGNWSDAARKGRLAITLPGNERDATLWGEVGIALARSSNQREALPLLETALHNNRFRSDLWREKARALLMLNDLDGANKAWMNAILVTDAPAQKMDMLNERCAALQQAQQWRLLLDAITEARMIVPQDRQWLVYEQVTRGRMIPPGIIPPALHGTWLVVREIQHVVVATPQLRDIPAGAFTMGARGGFPGMQDDGPPVPVGTAAYSVGIVPVTVTDYACAVRVGAVPPPPTVVGISWANQLARPDHPVVNVSWFAAMQYVAWLRAVTGEPWRLPTEAEWEKAARGPDERQYPWAGPWNGALANTSENYLQATTPIGTFPGGVSPFGAYDMAGNVAEWCSSLKRPYPYRPDDGREDAAINDKRVVRGGSWNRDARQAKVTARRAEMPTLESTDIGFRLVRDVL